MGCYPALPGTVTVVAPMEPPGTAACQFFTPVRNAGGRVIVPD